MPNQRLRLKTSGTAMKEHFQPEAGNEILKEFLLKLTPMELKSPTQRVHIAVVGLLGSQFTVLGSEGSKLFDGFQIQFFF